MDEEEVDAGLCLMKFFLRKFWLSRSNLFDLALWKELLFIFTEIIFQLLLITSNLVESSWINNELCFNLDEPGNWLWSKDSFPFSLVLHVW